MSDVITTDYLLTAYNSYRSFKARENENTLIPIDQLTEHIAETFCLNNSEISEWQYKYLLMWADSPSRPFITTEQLCRYLQVKHIEALDLYFSLYNYRIDVIQFISFLCIFVFLPTESLLLILLTVNHIYVNRNISDGQINIFLRSLGAESQSILYVKEWLKYVPRDDNTVTVLQLFDFIQSEEGILENVYHIKKELIIHFISQYGRARILERKFFYDHQAKVIKDRYKDNDNNKNNNNNNNDNNVKGNNNNNSNKTVKPKRIDIKLPKESCCSNFIRMFTGDPSPYYTEYRTLTQTEYVTIQMLVYEIRCKYGYSQRPYSICGSHLSKGGGSNSNNNYYCNIFKDNNNRMRRTTLLSNYSNNNINNNQNNNNPIQIHKQNSNNFSSTIFRSPATSNNRILIHSPIGNNRTLLMNSPLMNDNNSRRVVHPFISPKSSERRISGEFIVGTPVRKSVRPRIDINPTVVNDISDKEDECENGNGNEENVCGEKNYNSNLNTPVISPCNVVAQRAIGILDCSKSNLSLVANRRSTVSTNSKGSKESKGSKGSKNSAKVVPIEFSEEIVQ